MTFFTELNCSRFIWFFNRVKISIKILHKKLSLEDHMLVVLMKLKLGLSTKALQFGLTYQLRECQKYVKA